MVATAQTRMSLQGYMAWVHRCNDAAKVKDSFVPWKIGTDVVGYVKRPYVDIVLEASRCFQLLTEGKQLVLKLADHLDSGSPDDRTEALAGALERLRAQGQMNGWRSELYPVVTAFGQAPLCLIERAAAPYFGIKAYGVHINGFTRHAGGLGVWVARRSLSKPTWPGKLDNMVAGGQPYNISCADNVVKECEEEAGIPKELARTARAVGAVSYEALQPAGLKRDVLFCYDLELPPHFVPAPVDGEVEDFELMPVEEVAKLVTASDRFKENCNLVVIDFLMRHGYMTPEQPGYLELLTGLRSGDCR